jgi:RHS repeat-associated protein
VKRYEAGIEPSEDLTPEQTQFCDTTDYLLGGRLVLKKGRLDRFLFDGGYCSEYIPSGRRLQRPRDPSLWEAYVFAMTRHLDFYYYNQDHLGNVREVVDDKGKVQQATNYYPFGVPYTDVSVETSPDFQPYKYNGKELDKMYGLNTYDYGARQYNPVTGRWDRIDPLCEKYYNVSPYVYCMNNPVKYIDPDGRKIVISGNRKQRLLILTYLQKLTNDKLCVNQKGVVSIAQKGGRNKDKKLSTGTKLISSMIGNKYTATISLGNNGSSTHDDRRRDAFNGKGTDVSISFNPNQKPSVLTRDRRTGKSVTQTIPNEIVLGHEMIHGHRSMNGVAKEYNNYATYTYQGSDGYLYRKEAETEELETVGITGSYEYTENKLREEQGYNPRIKY